MCKLDRLQCLLSFGCNVWMIGDMISDSLTIYFTYYKGYENGTLSPAYWILGVFFMFLSTIANFLYFGFRWCKTGDNEDRHGASSEFSML